MSHTDVRGALRLALPAFVTGKVISFGIGWLTVWYGSRLVGIPSWSVFADRFSNWDGIAYKTVAEHGYPSGPLNLDLNSPSLVWGRFPGLPLAVHVLSYLFVDTVLAAVVFTSACELIALVYLVRLVRLESGDDETAQTAAWLVAVFPYAIFLSNFYTEAPFIAGATASLYYMRKGDHGLACVAGALATAMRLTGVFVIPSLLLERYLRTRRLLDPGLLLTALVGAPVLLFMLYAQARTGDVLAYFHVQSSVSYGQTVTAPWTGFQTTWDAAHALVAADNGAFYATGLVFAFLGIAVVGVMWLATRWNRQRIAPSLAVYSSVLLVSSLCLPNWGGIARYLMVMMPAYMFIAQLLRGRPGWRMGVIATSAALAAFATNIITSGRFLA